MRNLASLTILVLFLGVFPDAASAQEFYSLDALLRHKNSGSIPRRVGRWNSPSQAQEDTLQDAASHDINWIQCPPEAQDFGAICGTLPVPLDRSHPKMANIDIYFEVYLHTNPGPAESAILPNPGGPGSSTTALRAVALFFFGQNLDAHDILLIDDRGRGGSGAIECSELQHGTAAFKRAEADCAAQLGDADSWYGTGDVALDTEAVRAALGYDKVDYWGGSYGGMDVTAYATRFGQHLRSIVLDAPQGTPALRPFFLDGNYARATSGEVKLTCQRSPTCSIDHPNPGAEFQQLVEAIRSRPIEGKAHDASGNLVHVRLDESALLFLAVSPTGSFVNIGELLAAGKSLGRGDSAPLLRLGAEITPIVGDQGDAQVDSRGDFFAAMCVDARQPWDWSAPIQKRQQQFADAVSALHPNHFAPFSKDAGTSLSVSAEKQCLWWEKPTVSLPVTPPHPTYPNVPTLVMSGDLDTSDPSEEVHKVADLFPGSTFVSVAEAGHPTILWTQCAAALQAEFFETLQVGNIECTKTPETVWPAVGRFPLVAADARPAEVNPEGGNQIREAERKVVTVAVATAIDALKRTTFGTGDGAGLRSGTFSTSVDDNGNQITTLTNCVFATDVTVNGTVVWGADRSLTADLTLSGAGTAGGNLHIEGNWGAQGTVGEFRVTGTLGGLKVAVLVPEA